MALLTGVLLLDVLAVITALVAVGYAYVKWSLQYWQRNNVHVMDEKEVTGYSFNYRRRLRVMYDYAKARGWRHFGSYRMISKNWVPVDLELIKCVLTKDFNHFTDKGIFFNEKDDPISANLFNLNGKRWRHMRVRLTPVFTSGKLKAMFQTLIDCGQGMEQYIEKNVNTSDPVDIKEILARFSTNVIGSAAFGIECNTFKEPNSPFREYAKKFLGVSKAVRRGHMMGNLCPPLAKLLKLRTTDPEVSDFYTKVVEDTVAYRVKNNVKRKDFLQLLIEMKRARDGDENTDDDKTLSMAEIVAQCFLFFIAGFETSSTTMTFVLYELASHQDIQDRVRDELTTVLAKYNGQINYDGLNELTYLKQVIDETSRLFPAVPFLMRECSENYTVPGETAVIEKGTKVMVPVVGLHYDPDIFKNPEEFNPERFNAENRKNIPQYAYLPFGEGPRICIGERFGVMQAKVGLAFLLRNFRVTLNEKTQLPLKLSQFSFLPAAEGGIWLNLEKL